MSAPSPPPRLDRPLGGFPWPRRAGAGRRRRPRGGHRRPEQRRPPHRRHPSRRVLRPRSSTTVGLRGRYGQSVTNVPFYDHGWSKVNEPGQSVTNVPFYDHGWSRPALRHQVYGYFGPTSTTATTRTRPSARPTERPSSDTRCSAPRTSALGLTRSDSRRSAPRMPVLASTPSTTGLGMPPPRPPSAARSTPSITGPATSA